MFPPEPTSVTSKKKRGSKRPIKEAVTIYDIAKRAKVSPMTVSRSLRDDHDNPIKPSTAERIRKIAAEMNYRPSPAARSLILRKTFNVGFCINDPTFNYYSSLFYPLCMALQEELRGSGYRLGYYFFRPEAPEEFASFLADRQVFDAIVVLGRNLTGVEREAIRVNKVRAISLYEELPETASLVIDDEQGGRLVADYLWGRGFREVSMLYFWAGAPEMVGWNGRILGFRQRAGELGLSVQEISVKRLAGRNPREAAGFNAVEPGMLQRVLDSGTAGRCIYCTSDTFAISLIHQADELGLSLGKDVSIVGFDNIEGQFEKVWEKPRLTTINRPRDEVGRMAARLAMDFDAELEGLVHRFPVHLIENGSVGYGPAFSPVAPR